MIFCRDNPEKANELHEAGSSIFRQYKEGFHAFGDDVQRASICSSGVGAFRRKTNNCVKLLPVGNSTSSVEVVQPILRRHDFLRTGRAKRRQALTDFGTRELPLLMRSPYEGGAGVCVHAASVLIGATPKSFYDGPLAKVLIDENLRRHLPSGSREDRGLLSLDSLAHPETGAECCNHHCLSLRGVRSLEFLWDQYEHATDATGSELARSGGRGGGRGGGRVGGRGGRGGGRLATQGKGNGKGGSASVTALNSPTRRPFGAIMATEDQSGVLEEYPSNRGK